MNKKKRVRICEKCDQNKSDTEHIVFEKKNKNENLKNETPNELNDEQQIGIQNRIERGNQMKSNEK